MYIQNRQSIKAAARATSRTSYSADPDKKRAASRASYIADLDKRPLPPPPLPDADWSTNRNLYYAQHPKTRSIPIPSTTHIYTYTFVTISQKNFPKQVTEKALCQKVQKTSHVGMDFHQKNASPKTNETSDNAHCNACTDYPHITAQCIYCVATIPTSFQPHPPLSAPRPHTQLHTQYFLQHTQPSTIIIIYHPYILIHNHYIATSPNTAPHTTTLNLHRNVSYSHHKMHFAP